MINDRGTTAEPWTLCPKRCLDDLSHKQSSLYSIFD